MSSRAEFFESRLTPCNETSLKDDDCIICLEKHTRPIKLPCRHVFCDHCIRKWLSMPQNNKCPHCKAELFSLPEKVPRPMQANGRMSDRIQMTLTMSGLRSDRFLTFGVRGFTSQDLQAATARIEDDLDQYHTSSMFPEYTLINCRHIAAPLVAMANFMPSDLAVNGIGFGDQQHADWARVVSTLWKVLEAKDAMFYKTSSLAEELRRKITNRLRDSRYDVDSISFLRHSANPQSNRRYHNFGTLLQYVMFLCWREQRELQPPRWKLCMPRPPWDVWI